MLEARVPIFTINKDIIKKTLAQTSLGMGETSHSLLLEMLSEHWIIQMASLEIHINPRGYKKLFWEHLLLEYKFGNILILSLA